MSKVNGTYIKTQIEKTQTGSKGIFKSYVIEGIENFNLKRVFMASVSSETSGGTGNFYDNFDEAKTESLEMLNKYNEEFEKEIEELRKIYDPH
jgi:hypothetical protein